MGSMKIRSCYAYLRNRRTETCVWCVAMGLIMLKASNLLLEDFREVASLGRLYAGISGGTGSVA